MIECECGCVSVDVRVQSLRCMLSVCADLCVVWCAIMRFTGTHFQRGRVQALHWDDTECAG